MVGSAELDLAGIRLSKGERVLWEQLTASPDGFVVKPDGSGIEPTLASVGNAISRLRVKLEPYGIGIGVNRGNRSQGENTVYYLTRDEDSSGD